MVERLFTCASCHLEFYSDRSDEEARAEYEQNFPHTQGHAEELVCTTCYEHIRRWLSQFMDAYDPDVGLRTLRAATEEQGVAAPELLQLMVTTFNLLDCHMSTGGRLPEAWRLNRDLPTQTLDEADVDV